MSRSSAERTLSIIVRETIENREVLRYYERMGQIPGWFGLMDFLAFVAVDRYQRARGVVGDILEIGTYAGKSAILLGFLIDDLDQLVVCDVFDGSVSSAADHEENAKWYSGGVSRATFERWYRTFHEELPTIVELPSTDLAHLVFERPFRLVHIDGSHVYETVKSDISVARDLAAPGAIVALDDYGRPHAPGVGAAVWEAVFKSGLRPVFLTDCKLYAVWDTDAGLGEYMVQWAHGLGLQADPYSAPSGQLLFLHHLPPHPGPVERLTSLILPPAIPALARRVRQARQGRPAPSR
jgi:Methyltransferase domain